MPKKKNMMRRENKLKEFVIQSYKRVWDKEDKKKMMKTGMKMTFDYK